MAVICPFENRKCADCEYYKPTPGELHSYACFYNSESLAAKQPVARSKNQEEQSNGKH